MRGRLDVAAVDHHGNNHVDGYLAEGFACWWDRPLDVSFVLDQVEARGPVGVCGFSLGGYTAAAVRWTEANDITPPEQNGSLYARLVPGADGGTVGTPGSGHYGFVLPEHDDPQAKADVVRDSVAHLSAHLG